MTDFSRSHNRSLLLIPIIVAVAFFLVCFGMRVAAFPNVHKHKRDGAVVESYKEKAGKTAQYDRTHDQQPAEESISCAVARPSASYRPTPPSFVAGLTLSSACVPLPSRAPPACSARA